MVDSSPRMVQRGRERLRERALSKRKIEEDVLKVGPNVPKVKNVASAVCHHPKYVYTVYTVYIYMYMYIYIYMLHLESGSFLCLTASKSCVSTGRNCRGLLQTTDEKTTLRQNLKMSRRRIAISTVQPQVLCSFLPWMRGREPAGAVGSCLRLPCLPCI